MPPACVSSINRTYFSQKSREIVDRFENLRRQIHGFILTCPCYHTRMPTRQKKIAKKLSAVKPSGRASSADKAPPKSEDPAQRVAAFLARLGKEGKSGEAGLNPAQRREIARRAARLSSAPPAGKAEPKKR